MKLEERYWKLKMRTSESNKEFKEQSLGILKMYADKSINTITAYDTLYHLASSATNGYQHMIAEEIADCMFDRVKEITS